MLIIRILKVWLSSTASTSVLKQQTLTSCLTNIKSFGDNGVKRGQITNAIVFMIAKDGLPLNTVEKTGFNYLMKVVAPLYKVPARTTITYMIDDKYDTKMTEKWGITSNKVVAFITDNGANIVKAVTNVYGKNKHMPCFAHTLNLVASKPFDNKDGLEEAKNLLTAVKDITTYFKHNTNAADALKKAQDHRKKPLGADSVCMYPMEFCFLSIGTIC
ncbi:uncharacterized protein LOC101745866 [Bombyx mori]|uniref:uncharacterized protein LOC101745866 n=1 Tax=Bombyx mori TaxID=7091 RepID=UPI0006409DE5